MNKLNCGVIGFGKLGLLHAAICHAHPNARLTAVADTSSTILSFLKNEMNDLKIYEDYNLMLQECALDAVIIASPSHLHVPMAKKCFEKNIPVLIEKPLAVSYQQGKELHSFTNKPALIGYASRYSDTFKKAKQMLDEACIGKLQNFKATMYISQLFKQGKGWRYDPATSGGGVLMTQNCHLIDMLLWYFGMPKQVSGHCQSTYSKEVEDFVHSYFQFPNNFEGFLDASWSVRHHRTLTMSIFVQGEKGTLEVSDDEVKLFLDEPTKKYSKGWNVLKKPDLYDGVNFDVAGVHFSRQMDDFFQGIASKKFSGATLNDGINVQKVIEAIYQSAKKSGAPLSLEGSLG